jgi:hypothetical protein
MESRVPGRVVQ